MNFHRQNLTTSLSYNAKITHQMLIEKFPELENKIIYDCDCVLDKILYKVLI